MLSSTLGIILMILLLLVITVFMLIIVYKLFVYLFSNVLIKIVSILMILYFDYIAFTEFKVSHDFRILFLMIGSIILCIIILSIKRPYDDSADNHSMDRNNIQTHTAPKRSTQSKNVCPKCGCEYQYVPPQVVPTGEYEDYEGKGYWRYYTEDGMTKSEWITPMYHDPVYKEIGGYYECPVCGRRR